MTEYLQRTRLVRIIPGLALGISVLWLIADFSFEPVITALLGLAGLLSTRPTPFKLRSRTPSGDPDTPDA